MVQATGLATCVATCPELLPAAVLATASTRGVNQERETLSLAEKKKKRKKGMKCYWILFLQESPEDKTEIKEGETKRERNREKGRKSKTEGNETLLSSIPPRFPRRNATLFPRSCFRPGTGHALSPRVEEKGKILRPQSLREVTLKGSSQLQRESSGPCCHSCNHPRTILPSSPPHLQDRQAHFLTPRT